VKDDSEEAKSIVRKGLGSNFEKHVSALLKEYPHLSVGLVGKDAAGAVVGGLTGYTVLGTLTIDEFWVQREYRNQGLGTMLLEAAEGVAKERMCLALQTYCHDFQNLDFMYRRGFMDYGYCNGYRNGSTEHYLIRRLA
jgi:GNAT superfamily N-acetyltransferase